MPVGLDRFLRVVSRGKYNTIDLFNVRAGKVDEAVTSLDRSLIRLRELGPDQLPEFEEELRRYQAKLQIARGLVAGNPDMDILRHATEMLDPIKEHARITEERARKLTVKVEAMRQTDRVPGRERETWQTYCQEAKLALLELPSGTGGLMDQLAVLDTHVRRLQAARDSLLGVLVRTIPPRALAGMRDTLRDTCEELLTALRARKAYLQGMLDRNSTSERQVYQSKAQNVVAANRVLDRALGELEDNDVNRRRRTDLQAIKTKLQARAQNLIQGRQNVQVRDLTGVLGPKKASSATKQKYLQLFATHGIDGIDRLPLETPDIREEDLMELVLLAALDKTPKQLAHEYHQAQVEALNDKAWPRLDRPVQLQHNGRPVQVRSSIIPASNLGNRYAAMNGKGVCSHDTTAYKTATNLAATEVQNSAGEVIFQGLRHGVNCAYGITPEAVKEMSDAELERMLRDLLPGQPVIGIMDRSAEDKRRVLNRIRTESDDTTAMATAMRTRANDNRATDVVVAALVRNPAKLAAAQAHPDRPVEINLSSMSLVTPDAWRGGEADEAKMLREQMAAWERLSGPPQPRTIKIRNAAGDADVDVQVNVSVTAFNFGVNAGAVTGLGYVPGASGWGTSNEFNTRAMDGTIGTADERRGGRFGGRVGRWLVIERRDLALMPDGDPKVKRGKNIVVVERLAQQIADMWDRSTYKYEGNEPYKMVSRLAVLTFKMGDDAAFNCKSGKDRTGQLDVEAKMLATQIDLTGDVPEPDHEPDAVEKSNRLSMAVNSGNHEMQQYNTGHMGFKLEGVDSLDNSMPDDEAVATYRGSSKFTKA